MTDASPIDVRRLTIGAIADYRAIRLAALSDCPGAFGTSYEEESAKSASALQERLETSAVFGAYEAGRIAGLAAYRRQSGLRERHKAFVWGVYLRPDLRGRGAGVLLLRTMMAAAALEVEQLTLTVVADNAPAIALYRRLGFAPYGLESRSLTTPSGYADEVLMACRLGSQGAA